MTKNNLGIMEARGIPPPITDPAILDRHVGTAAHRQAAERIARESMTLLRDTQHMLPLKKEGRTLVIRPAKGVPDVDEPARGALAAWPGTEVLDISPDPGPDEIEAAMAGVNRATTLVMLLSDASRHPGQASLARTLLTAAPGKTVLVASGAPYDAALFPEAPCVAATYGDVPVSLTALGQALFGKIPFRAAAPWTSSKTHPPRTDQARPASRLTSHHCLEKASPFPVVGRKGIGYLLQDKKKNAAT